MWLYWKCAAVGMNSSKSLRSFHVCIEAFHVNLDAVML